MTHAGYLVAGCGISLVMLGGYALRLVRSGRRLAPQDSTPGDQAARDRIAAALDDNLFVQAGAGTGKTTSLIDRMVALVVDDGVAIEGIAAITFTERAAAELGDRFRRALDDITRDDTDAQRRSRAEAALNDVDLASLSTVHGFARRLLAENPLEAGLPPGFDLLDEVTSHLAFAERWDELQEVLLADDGLARTILLANGLGITMDHLRDMARILDDRWDLLAPDTTGPGPDDVELDATSLLDLLDAVLRLDRNDIEADDRLRLRLARIGAVRGAIAGAHDEASVARVLASDDRRDTLKVSGTGTIKVWGEHKAEILSAANAAMAEWKARHAAVVDAVLRRLVAELGLATLRAAEDRRRLGVLTFHDVLVCARNLLTDPVVGPGVRDALHFRFHHLLLDEFQDTDPVQLELALLLTDPAADPSSQLDGFAPGPGSLFLVGDPKQSIYRFRRADIALYLDARRSLPTDDVALTDNFRTTTPIIDWINAVFGELIGSGADGSRHEDRSRLMQPAYVPLVGRRPAASNGPSVTILGRTAHGKDVKADELQHREATEVATAITAAVADGWSVEEGNGTTRPCRFGDVAILLPGRNSLHTLEEALEEAGIPYRAESSSLLFATPQVRDLLMVLRAIDDPTDDLAVVSALRTPYLGCGDDDLARWRVHHGGTWNHQAPQPDGDESVDAVASGLAWLGEMHLRRHLLGPSGLLEQLVVDRRVLEVGVGEDRPRDAWRRVRLLADRARAYSDAGGGSLRGFTNWCLAQADEKGRVAETVLPESDDDAVRILTIHGAKGLEFPITVLSGMSTTNARSDRNVNLLVQPGAPPEAKVRKGSQTSGYKAAHDLDQRFEDAERLRLLYVAVTRARDHLIVSVHRDTNIDPSASTRPGPGRLLARALDTLPAGRNGTDLVATTRLLPGPTPPSGKDLPDRGAWIAERDAALTRAARPNTIAATRIASHAAPNLPVDRARPGEVGRHGTAVGRAVHGALELLDFDTDDPAPVVRESAAAEGVLGDLRTIDALVRAGLDSEVVRLAAGTRHWRELYVAAPVDDAPDAPVVEGYIDLAILDDGDDGPGLVIVDYKTDAVVDDADRAAKAGRYRLQGATYAVAAQRSTGLPVHRVILCFLAADGATEMEIADLEDAMAEVRAIARELAGS